MGSEMTVSNGQSGICQLRVWGGTFSYPLTPRRDIAMENGMIIHEFAHGMTRRMVDGGTARCFDTLESEALGEGFSDIMAEWIEQKPIPPGSSLPDYVFGDGLQTDRFGRPLGLRSHPYSISKITNPLRYSTAGYIITRGRYKAHKAGVVWGNMLYNVYAALVKKHGFSENARTDPTTPEGNVVFMRLFSDALSLMPCNPTFVDARDAWTKQIRTHIGAPIGVYCGRNLPAGAWESMPCAVSTATALTRHRIAGTSGGHQPIVHPLHQPLVHSLHQPIIHSLHQPIVRFIHQPRAYPTHQPVVHSMVPYSSQ
ncbi:Fungalysin metallopeptidase-domain-containing protein [Infundibulicybe gibba]|nr:Fungalysin metallopeptidase-domain-containing protein [Infundibulicybe gibba]